MENVFLESMCCKVTLYSHCSHVLFLMSLIKTSLYICVHPTCTHTHTLTHTDTPRHTERPYRHTSTHMSYTHNHTCVCKSAHTLTHTHTHTHTHSSQTPVKTFSISVVCPVGNPAKDSA